MAIRTSAFRGLAISLSVLGLAAATPPPVAAMQITGFDTDIANMRSIIVPTWSIPAAAELGATANTLNTNTLSTGALPATPDNNDIGQAASTTTDILPNDAAAAPGHIDPGRSVCTSENDYYFNTTIANDTYMTTCGAAATFNTGGERDSSVSESAWEVRSPAGSDFLFNPTARAATAGRDNCDLRS